MRFKRQGLTQEFHQRFTLTGAAAFVVAGKLAVEDELATEVDGA